MPPSPVTAHTAPHPPLTDHQLIAAARRAGLCFPDCWNLEVPEADQSEESRWIQDGYAQDLSTGQTRQQILERSEHQRRQHLQQLHRFAELIRDQELDACRLWVSENISILDAAALLDARRPKPPSLKELALAKTNSILNDPERALLIEVREALELNRCALEALPDDPA